MCGLLGMAGNGINNWDLKIFKDLGIASQLRGTDGAGVFQTRSVAGKGWDQTEGAKNGGNFIDLMMEIDTDKKSRVLGNQSVDVVLGHVRAATKGFINDSNAHPFDFNNIVGAHNGTLKDKKYDHHFKTDSELMFQDINNRGMETVLSELDRDSAFAISLYSHVDKHLYFVRNELRPLAFAFLKDRGVMYWASEIDMLKFVLKRAGEDASYYTVHPNIMIRVRPSNISKASIEKGPLTLLEHFGKLDRPLPTVLQKQKDEREKKKQEEEKKKEEALKVSVPQVQAPAQQQPEGNVVPFVKQEVRETKKEVSSRSSQGEFLVSKVSQTCSCGGKRLTLLDQSLAIRGKSVKFSHNHVTDSFHCGEACSPLEVKANGA